jgi:hypothetical protein
LYRLAEKQTTSSEDEMSTITTDDLDQAIAARMADLVDAIAAMKHYQRSCQPRRRQMPTQIPQNHLSRTQTVSRSGMQPPKMGNTQILRSPSSSSMFSEVSEVDEALF